MNRRLTNVFTGGNVRMMATTMYTAHTVKGWVKGHVHVAMHSLVAPAHLRRKWERDE